MAKIIKCPGCGKEIKKGLFGGEDMLLDVGEATISCCSGCYEYYNNDAKCHAERFGAKLRNYKLVTKKKKLTEAEIMAMYMTYRTECLKYVEQSTEEESCTVILGALKITEDGFFSAKEFSNDFLHKDVDLAEVLKSVESATDEEEFWFTKNDITKLEYAPNGIGMGSSAFERVFSYTVRFNDESQITYRPCITRVAVIGKGFLFGFRKNAEKQLEEKLTTFRNCLGSTVPVVRVKK